MITDLIAQLESWKFVYYSQNFHSSVTNWLPFYWKNFRQTTRYTYQIKDISNPDKCFEQFSYAKQKHINKIKEKLVVDFSMSPQSFYEIAEKNWRLLGEKISYTRDVFFNIYNNSEQRKQSCIIAVKDTQNNVHSALFVIWDSKSAYALISTIHPDFRQSGASTLMFWEAIKYVSKKTKIFDFEGSVNESIENSYRQFGTEQVPYFAITKHNSFLLKPFLP